MTFRRFCRILGTEMRILHLHLINFRNFAERGFSFGKTLQVITGPNGSGKTNLLEAIGYLSLGKSFRRVPDEAVLAWGTSHFLVEGEVEDPRGVRYRLKVRYHEGRKEAFMNGKRLRALRQLFEVFPVVYADPLENAVIRGATEERRDFFDDFLGLLDPVYQRELAAYRRALRQKNAALKVAEASLAHWNRQLEHHGRYLVEQRRVWVHRLNQMLQNGKRDLLPVDQVQVAYEPSVNLHEGILDTFAEEERERGVALYGPHRDRFHLLYRSYPLEEVASHGERWLIYYTLLLTFRELLARTLSRLPVLLLDEPFHVLDRALTRKLALGLQGQVIATAVYPPGLGEERPIWKNSAIL